MMTFDYFYSEVTITINLDSIIVGQMQFTIAEHYNSSFIFESRSSFVYVTASSK